MSIIDKMLKKQKATYWEHLSGDRYDTTYYAFPVELSCRWEDIFIEFISHEGRKEISRARVYVSADVKPRGILALGPRSSYVSPDTLALVGSPVGILMGVTQVPRVVPPRPASGGYEIREYTKLPTLKQNKILRTAYVV